MLSFILNNYFENKDLILCLVFAISICIHVTNAIRIYFITQTMENKFKNQRNEYIDFIAINQNNYEKKLNNIDQKFTNLNNQFTNLKNDVKELLNNIIKTIDEQNEKNEKTVKHIFGIDYELLNIKSIINTIETMCEKLNKKQTDLQIFCLNEFIKNEPCTYVTSKLSQNQIDNFNIMHSYYTTFSNKKNKDLLNEFDNYIKNRFNEFNEKINTWKEIKAVANLN